MHMVTEVTTPADSTEAIPLFKSFQHSLLMSEREVENSAFACFAFGAHLAAVAMDDALDGRQADTGSFELLGSVQALEHAEKLSGITHIETRTIIDDTIDCPAFDSLAIDQDMSGAATARIFDRVIDQIEKGLAQQGGIAEGRR